MKVIKNTQIGDRTEIENYVSIVDSTIGKNTHIWRFTNIYGAEIESNCMIGTFVEIQEDTIVHSGSRIQSHSFLCSLVEIGHDVFVGHGVMFINDRFPPSKKADWEPTLINDNVVIGSNATILPVEIGENAMVAAGSVVVDDVPENVLVAGNPAEIIRER